MARKWFGAASRPVKFVNFRNSRRAPLGESDSAGMVKQEQGTGYETSACANW